MAEQDAFTSTPGSRVRYDEHDTSWRVPADRQQARELVAKHRRGEIDVFELRSPDESSHLARELWIGETKAVLHWLRTAYWVSSGAGYPRLPTPAPPPELAEWSPERRREVGVAARYDEYLSNRAEARRISQAQTDAYAARDRQ
jgi:hypothetical protein